MQITRWKQLQRWWTAEAAEKKTEAAKNTAEAAENMAQPCGAASTMFEVAEQGRSG